MLYMVSFTINIPPMLVYIPYMDPMGISLPKLWLLTSYDSSCAWLGAAAAAAMAASALASRARRRSRTWARDMEASHLWRLRSGTVELQKTIKTQVFTQEIIRLAQISNSLKNIVIYQTSSYMLDKHAYI